MKLLVLLVLVGLTVLAVYFTVKAVQTALANSYDKKWRSDFRTLESGETEVFVAKGDEEIVYSSHAPLKNWEAGGKTTFDRQAEIDIALDEAKLWAEKHAK